MIVSSEAIHEAGHAVMCVYLRYSFKSVNIIVAPWGPGCPEPIGEPNPMQGGEVASLSPKPPYRKAFREIKGVFYQVDQKALARRESEDRILILAAGSAAEGLTGVPKKSREISRTSDWMVAEDEASKLGIHRDGVKEFLDQMERRAEDILGRRDIRLALQLVAGDLFIHKCLSAAQVRSCCTHMSKRRTPPLPILLPEKKTPARSRAKGLSQKEATTPRS